MSIYIRANDGPSTTVACDFKADGTGTTTVNTLLSNDWTACNDENARSAGSNGTLRLSIVSTDHNAGIHLGSLTNGGYSDGTGTYQNLIKKASLKINNIHQDGSSDCSTYPSYTPAGVFATFSKRIVDTNRYDRDHVANGSRAGFVFPRSDNSSSWSSYITHPADPNIQYVALPSHPNTGYNKTSTSYIDQGVSCLDSVVTLEVRGSDPSNFHYRLIIEKTGNEYDLGLCSTLGFAAIHVESSDRWRVGSYKEVDLAYIEYFDDYYIDNLGNITTTKPR